MSLEVIDYDKKNKSLLVDFEKDSFSIEDKDETYSLNLVTVADRYTDDYAYDLLKNENSILYNGQEFVIKKCEEVAQGNIRAKSITAMHITFSIQDDYRYDNLTGLLSADECLDYIFRTNKQGFRYKLSDPENKLVKVDQENFGRSNLLKLIEEIMSDYDLAVIRDNKLFTFIPNESFSKKTQNQIRYLYNTEDVSFEIDTYELKTQVRGYGKKKEESDGGGYFFEPFTYTSPEADKWGVRVQDPIEDDRFTIKSNMLAKMKRELKDIPQVHGEVAMKELDFEVKRGDLVRFIYEPLGVNQFIKVVGVTYYPFSDKPPTVELDTNKKTMISYIAALMRGGKR